MASKANIPHPGFFRYFPKLTEKKFKSVGPQGSTNEKVEPWKLKMF